MKKAGVLIIVMFMGLGIFASEMIAVVDFNLIVEKYEKSASAQEFLQMEFGKRQQDIVEEQNYLKEKQERLEKNRDEGKISDEEFKKQTNEFQVEVVEFQRKTQKYEREIKELEEERFEKIREDINKVVKKIAQKKKISYVLEKGVVHFGGLDITEEVINLLNKE